MTTTAGTQDQSDPFAALGPEVGRDPWEVPVPLEEVARPPFPRGVLPSWLERYACELSTELQVPVDLVALLALAVCAAACSQRARIRVRARFEQPLNLWVLVPLPSGNRKSAAVEDVTEPVRRWQKEQAEALRESVAEGQSRVRMAHLAVTRAEAAAAKPAEQIERLRAEAEALELARTASALRAPQVPRLLAHDITAERLASLMSEHDERMAIIAPEGTIFELMSGRYSAGIPNIDIYKAAHAGDMFAVDREADRGGRTEGRPPIILERPALTLAISPQPSVVRKLTDKEEFRGEGLLARFLYSLPISLVGRRQVEPPCVQEQTLASYAAGIARLLALPTERDAQGKPVPAILRCTPAARAALVAFERELEPQLGPFGELDAIADWGSKLGGQAARLAGVLHLASLAGAGDPAALDRPVEEAQMEAALALARYFIPHARAAFALMGADEVAENARHLLAWTQRYKERTGKESFSQHECWVGNRSARFRAAEDTGRPLAKLCEHKYLRAREQAPPQGSRKTGRPASALYDINPLSAPGNAETPHAAQNGGHDARNEEQGEGFVRFVGFMRPSPNGKTHESTPSGATMVLPEDDDSVEI